MAVIFSQCDDGVLYEVRTAGLSKRLYTNGILHSQFHPGRILSGSVWDLLMLGGFLHPEPLRKVLVLGVGGGTVIRQLLHFFPKAQFTGIDLSELHNKLAQNYFGLKDKRVKLIRADAAYWLDNTKMGDFDLIIDDVFGEIDGEPDRAIPIDRCWLRKVRQKARNSKVVTVHNVLEPKDVSTICSYFRNRSVFRLTTPNCYNIVVVTAPVMIKTRHLNNRLKMYRELDRGYKTCLLKYRIRQIQ